MTSPDETRLSRGEAQQSPDTATEAGAAPELSARETTEDAPPSLPPTDPEAPSQAAPMVHVDSHGGGAGGDLPAAAGDVAMAAMPSPDLAAIRARAAALGISNPLPALAIAGIAWIGGLVAAVAVLGMLVLSGLIASEASTVSSATGGSSGDLSGIGILLAIPFQILALAGLGSFGGHVQLPFLGDFSASVRFIPFPVTLALVLIPFFGARLVARRRRRARALGVAVESMLAGAVVALLVTLGALAIAVRIPLDGSLSARLHAAGPDSLLGTWLMVGVAYALGQLTGEGLPSRTGRLNDLFSGARLAALHATVVSVLAFVGVWLYVVITAIRGGDDLTSAIFSTPLVALASLGQLVAGACGLGMLGAISARESLGSVGLGGSGLGSVEHISVFSAPWWVWLLSLLLGAILLLLAASAWGAGRTIVPGDIVAKVVSWAALPAVYFVGAVLLTVLGHVSGSAWAPGEGSAGASVGLAPWVPLLAALWGATVEGLSRLLSPLVRPYIPGVVVRLVRGQGSAAEVTSAMAPTGAAQQAAPARSTVVAAGHASPAEAEAGPASTSSHTASAPAPVPLGGGAQPNPMTAVSRRRLLLILGGVGGGIAVVIGAMAAVVAIGSTVFSPEHEVEAYLDALAAGDYTAAAQIAPPNSPNANRVLLTDAVGAKTEKRITSYTIDDVQISGDQATVTTTLDQDGERAQQTFTVDRAGSRFLIFPAWRLQSIEYASLSFSVPPGVEKVTVNGVEIDTSSLEVTTDEGGYEVARLPVLPGRYQFSGPALGEYLEAEPITTTVRADGTWADSNGEYVYLEYLLNEAGKQKVQDDVNAYIDQCAATGQPRPGRCPLGVYTYNNSPGTWKITTYPVVELEWGEEGGYYLSSATTGSASFSYTDDSFGTPTQRTLEDSIDVNGTVTFDEKGDLTIEYSTL